MCAVIAYKEKQTKDGWVLGAPRLGFIFYFSWIDMAWYIGHKYILYIDIRCLGPRYQLLLLSLSLSVIIDIDIMTDQLID